MLVHPKNPWQKTGGICNIAEVLMKNNSTTTEKTRFAMLLKQKSFFVKPHEAKHQWFILDASGKTLGRLATEIAKVLRGKHKPTFTTFADAGDGVIVINAEKVRVTGAKEAQKIYRYHTGAMSGMREIPFRTMRSRNPAYIIEHAVKGMMPQSRLADAQLKRLRVFAGTEHGMEAQKPVQVNI